MAPRKELFGKTEYSERGLHEDLLQLLPGSTTNVMKAKSLIPKDPRIKVAEGLYDTMSFIREAKIGTLNASGDSDITGLDLFKLGFSQRNAPHPVSNIWHSDLGKLVVPSVFLDVDLMIQIAKSYDPITREVRDVKGQLLIKLSAEEIRKVFRLSEPSGSLENIDFEELRQVYDAQRNYFRGKLLKDLCTKIGKMVVMGQNTQEPFKIDYFDGRAKGAYWSLCQVFGEDVSEKMPIHLMSMVIQILHAHVSITFDFAPFIAELIHNVLVKIKKNEDDRPFCWYSFMMYMFLFKGANYFE